MRQGCCLSPYIFLICSELLSHAIRTSVKINGINVTSCISGESKNYEVKISQYADDTIVYIDGSCKSLTETLETLDNFALFSGQQVNYDKSTIFRIGSLKRSNVMYCADSQLKWSNSSTNYLGMLIAHDVHVMVNFNFNAKLEEIKSTLQVWKGRNLTLLGKNHSVQNFCLIQIGLSFFSFYLPTRKVFYRFG